ncbi:unnamed protein product, partial [marine sediment metagenome]
HWLSQSIVSGMARTRKHYRGSGYTSDGIHAK